MKCQYVINADTFFYFYRVSLFACFSAPVLPENEIETFPHPTWDFKGSEGWKAGEGIISFQAEEGRLKFSSAGFSYIVSPELRLNSEIDNLIKIRMKSDVPYSDAAVFWFTMNDKMFDIRKNIPFSVRGDCLRICPIPKRSKRLPKHLKAIKAG